MKGSPKLKVVTRYRLNKKDKKSLVEEVAATLGAGLAQLVEESELVEVAKVKDGKIAEIYFLNGVVAMVRFEGEGLFPSLYFIYKSNVPLNLPAVYVDAGAVPHILNGADVMVPGIKRIEGSFKAGDKVFVRELEKGRIIAMGVSLLSSAELEGAQKGKAVKTLHYLGDEIWQLSG